MTIKRWNAKRDQNEGEIVDALQKAGALVMRLDKFDLLVKNRHGALFMLDAKSKQGRPTRGQERLSACGWPLRYVQTPEDALRAIGCLK